MDKPQFNDYFQQLFNGSSDTSQDASKQYFEQLTGKPFPNPGAQLDDRALARAQADTGDQTYNNLCEKFVEQSVYGKSGLYPSAVDAWNNYVQTGKQTGGNVLEAPKGALVYFAGDSSNENYGHTGIADGQGGFVSATSNGVQTVPLESWMQTTGQKPLGYVIP